MVRIPYEIVAPEAEKLFNRLLDNFNDMDLFEEYEEVYVTFIQACGWTLQEYNEEQLKRIDGGWNVETN